MTDLSLRFVLVYQNVADFKNEEIVSLWKYSKRLIIYLWVE